MEDEIRTQLSLVFATVIKSCRHLTETQTWALLDKYFELSLIVEEKLRANPERRVVWYEIH